MSPVAVISSTKAAAQRVLRRVGPALTPIAYPIVRRRLGPVRMRRALVEGTLYHQLTIHPRAFRARTFWGATIAGDTADLVQRTIALTGVWEPRLSALLVSTLRPGDVFVDVGANVGYFSLLASHLVGPTGLVVAVEPSPSIHALLVRNLEINGASNVRALECAAGREDGVSDLFLERAGNIGNTTTAPRATSDHRLEATVPVRSMDDVLASIDPTSIRIVKVDVEGSEAAVLGGLRSTVSRLGAESCLVVEVTPAWAEADLDRELRRVEDHGFTASAIDDDALELSFTTLDWHGPRVDPHTLSEQTTLLFTRRAGSSGAR